MNQTLLFAAATLACVSLEASSFAAPPRYQLDVATLPVNANASSLNESGLLVGDATFPGETMRPFIYDSQSRSVLTLDYAGAGWGGAVDINESGWVTGVFGINDDFAAFIYDGVSVSLVDFSEVGRREGVGIAINDAGHVAGTLFDRDGVGPAFQSFLFDGNSTVIFGGEGGVSITNSDLVVGGARDSQNSDRSYAFAYQNGEFTDLTNGPEFADTWSLATDVNESGLIVGSVRDPIDGDSQATIFAARDIQPLGPLPNGETPRVSYANGVNDAGTIVGAFEFSPAPDWSNHAFVYIDSALYDLNDYVIDRGDLAIVDAQDINNRGQVLARGLMPDGTSHVVLLTPVPEPTTLALAAITLLAAATQFKKAGQGGAKV